MGNFMLIFLPVQISVLNWQFYFSGDCRDQHFHHPTNPWTMESPQHLFAVPSFLVVPCNTKNDLLNDNPGREADVYHSKFYRKQSTSNPTIHRLSQSSNRACLSYYHHDLGIRPVMRKRSSLAIVEFVDFSQTARYLIHDKCSG